MHTHTRAHASARAHTHTHTNTHAHAHIHARARARTQIHTTRTHVHARTRMRTHSTRTYTHSTYTHARTHMHAHERSPAQCKCSQLGHGNEMSTVRRTHTERCAYLLHFRHLCCLLCLRHDSHCLHHPRHSPSFLHSLLVPYCTRGSSHQSRKKPLIFLPL